MAKISEVEIPALLFDEQGSAPTTPASTLWKLYFKSDGLYIVDDAGAETGPLGTGGGGSSGGLAFVESPTLTTGVFTYTLAGGYDPDWIELHLVGVTVDTDGTQINLELKIGGSWISTGYAYYSWQGSTGGTSNSARSTSDSTAIIIPSSSWGVGTGSGKCAHAVIRIWEPTGSARKAGEHKGFYNAQTSNSVNLHGGFQLNNTSAIEAVRVSGSSGAITGGKMLVYGVTQ